MAKQRYQFYTFNAGVNFRDEAMAMNELGHCNNMYWDGTALRRRKGFVKRHAALDISSVWASGSIIGIEEYYYYRARVAGVVADEFDLWASIDSGGGSTADKIVQFFLSDMPSSAGETFTLTETSTADGLSWADGDPISAVVFADTLWVANGSDNPYVLGGYSTATSYSEVPICNRNNGDTADGADIIDNESSGHSWSGCQWLGVQDQFIYLSDNKTMFFGINDQEVHPASEMGSASLATRISGVQDAMSADWYFSISPQSRPDGILIYRDYMFLYGQEDIWHLYHRYSDTHKADYDKQRVSDKGVWSNLCVTPRAAFWVSYDGIYGFDGVNVQSLGKKIWPRIESQHSSLPDDLTDTSLAYHDGRVWVSFPNGTDKEVYVFDPDHIYQDSMGDTFAPFFRFTYVDSSDNSIAFYNLKDYDGHLFATNGAQLYELDVGYKDDNTQGIDCLARSAYWDFDNPAYRKVYGRAVYEITGMTSSTASLGSLYGNARRDYGEDTESLGYFDVTYSGAERAYVELDIPYQCDGNSLSLSFACNASGASAYDDLVWYGVAVEAEVKDHAKKER